MKGILTHFLQKLRASFIRLSVCKQAVYLIYKGNEDLVNMLNGA